MYQHGTIPDQDGAPVTFPQAAVFQPFQLRKITGAAVVALMALSRTWGACPLCLCVRRCHVGMSRYMSTYTSDTLMNALRHTTIRQVPGSLCRTRTKTEIIPSHRSEKEKAVDLTLWKGKGVELDARLRRRRLCGPRFPFPLLPVLAVG